MESDRFDHFARFAARGASRREVVRAGFAALGGALALGPRAAARQECTAPFILCDGECVYSLTSNAHCGECGNACGQDVCVEGVCTSCEAIGQTTCANAVTGDLYCADLSTNVNNCGACGNRCTTGPCEAGVCVSTQECAPGLTECMGVCVDLQTDLAHCGDCFTSCMGEAPPGQSSVGECVAGVCRVACLERFTLCDGACADGSCAPAVDGEPFNLSIAKWTCEADPGPMGFGLEPPADCRPTGGIAFEVATAGGEVLDGCTIPAGSGGCNVEVPYGIGSVFVYEAVATAPAGYAPRENPIEVRVPDAPVTGEAPTAIFVNLPVADGGDGTPGGVTTLPNTGNGTATGGHRRPSLAPAALAGAGVALVMASWRRIARRDATG